ncbi:MAG: citryl-CoA lyase [Pseudomonadota bacterium]
MSTFQKGPKFLQEHIGVVKSRMGACFGGNHTIFRGHNLHTELKNMSWMELYMFGITGRRFSLEQLRLLEAMWTYTSYPDARIWNNRIAGLAGSSRSTGSLGIASALAVSEGSIYGCSICFRAITFFIHASDQLKKEKTLEESVCSELQLHRNIAGYGRPLLNKDERNVHILALAKDLGLDQGSYLNLALEIDNFLLTSRRRMRINYAGLISALCADMGLLPQELYLFTFPIFLAGMLPCFIEASSKPEGVLFPTSCADIAYEGHSHRSWLPTIIY